MSQHDRSELKWTFGMCPLDTDAETFGPFADLVALWQSRVGPERRVPARTDVDFYDFKRWLGRVFIARVQRDPFDLEFSLWGTKLIEWWGVDYTNKRLGEHSKHPHLWKLLEIRYFEAMDRDPFIGLSSGFLGQHGRPDIRILGLDLPFSDGEGLSHVISAHIRIDPKDEIETLCPGNPVSEWF